MNIYNTFTFQLLICYILSLCIGIERQYRKLVGLRTIILVSIGSFLFVKFSFISSNSDVTRIASGVASGIGFLGAGLIIKNDKTIKGLTTSATLWCSSAIGVLCSGGLLFEASIGTLIILFTNIMLKKIDNKINILHKEDNMQ